MTTSDRAASLRVALVTGAAGGLGSAIAERLAAAGYELVVCDLEQRRGDLEGLAERLQPTAGKVSVATGDVTDSADFAAMVEVARSRHGGLDVLVNNAGIGDGDGTAEEIEPDSWDRLLAVNLKSVYLGIKHAVPAMRARGGGSIVNIASISAFWIDKGHSAYVASKAAVVGLTKAAGADFAGEGIRVTSVCPGYIDAGITQRYLDSAEDPAGARAGAGLRAAAGRLGSAEEIAAAVEFLAGDSSVYVTGTSLVVDGGATLGVV